MTYYINRSGQQYGPYSVAELQNMIAQGQLSATDNAWGEGMTSWAPVSEILAGASGPPPQQPQQPAAQQQYPPQQQYQPQQPQYQQPQAGYGGPAAPAAPYAAPAYAGGYPQQPVPGAVPPGLHWFVVLLLSCIPFFILIWLFVQASFVKKIDPRSKATMWLALGIVSVFAMLGILVYAFVDVFNHFPDLMANVNQAHLTDDQLKEIVAYITGKSVLLLLYLICAPLAWIFMLVGYFSERNSIQRYYNTAEPIGLRLSGVMTFFFNILYFQYHFRRIARWKQTGQLI